MKRNVAGQKLLVYAYTVSTGLPKTADAANITCWLNKDGTSAQTNDVHPDEVDAVNAPGLYSFNLTQAETNYVDIFATPKSSTSGVQVDYRPIVTEKISVSDDGATINANIGGNVNGSVASVTADTGGDAHNSLWYGPTSVARKIAGQGCLSSVALIGHSVPQNFRRKIFSAMSGVNLRGITLNAIDQASPGYMALGGASWLHAGYNTVQNPPGQVAPNLGIAPPNGAGLNALNPWRWRELTLDNGEALPTETVRATGAGVILDSAINGGNVGEEYWFAQGRVFGGIANTARVIWYRHPGAPNAATGLCVWTTQAVAANYNTANGAIRYASYDFRTGATGWTYHNFAIGTDKTYLSPNGVGCVITTSQGGGTGDGSTLIVGGIQIYNAAATTGAIWTDWCQGSWQINNWIDPAWCSDADFKAFFEAHQIDCIMLWILRNDLVLNMPGTAPWDQATVIAPAIATVKARVKAFINRARRLLNNPSMEICLVTETGVPNESHTGSTAGPVALTDPAHGLTYHFGGIGTWADVMGQLRTAMFEVVDEMAEVGLANVYAAMGSPEHVWLHDLFGDTTHLSDIPNTAGDNSNGNQSAAYALMACIHSGLAQYAASSKALQSTLLQIKERSARLPDAPASETTLAAVTADVISALGAGPLGIYSAVVRGGVLEIRRGDSYLEDDLPLIKVPVSGFRSMVDAELNWTFKPTAGGQSIEHEGTILNAGEPMQNLVCYMTALESAAFSFGNNAYVAYAVVTWPDGGKRTIELATHVSKEAP